MLPLHKDRTFLSVSYTHCFTCLFHRHGSFEISDPPQLDVAAPLHLHRPLTLGVCWVTLQGYVTLSPLNDASTRCPQENCDYFHLVNSHSNQICVCHSSTERFYCCKRDQWCYMVCKRADNFQKNKREKKIDYRIQAAISITTNIHTGMCVLQRAKTAKTRCWKFYKLIPVSSC